jgi:hypothetical protein
VAEVSRVEGEAEEASGDGVSMVDVGAAMVDVAEEAAESVMRFRTKVTVSAATRVTLNTLLTLIGRLGRLAETEGAVLAGACASHSRRASVPVVIAAASGTKKEVEVVMVAMELGGMAGVRSDETREAAPSALEVPMAVLMAVAMVEGHRRQGWSRIAVATNGAMTGGVTAAAADRAMLTTGVPTTDVPTTATAAMNASTMTGVRTVDLMTDTRTIAGTTAARKVYVMAVEIKIKIKTKVRVRTKLSATSCSPETAHPGIVTMTESEVATRELVGGVIETGEEEGGRGNMTMDDPETGGLTIAMAAEEQLGARYVTVTGTGTVAGAARTGAGTEREMGTMTAGEAVAAGVGVAASVAGRLRMRGGVALGGGAVVGEAEVAAVTAAAVAAVVVEEVASRTDLVAGKLEYERGNLL